MAYSKEVVVYCDNTDKLVLELKNKYPQYITEINGEVFFNITKTPTVKKGKQSLTLVLCKSYEDLQLLKGIISLEVLGTYGEIFKNDVLLSKYKNVYDFTKDKKIIIEGKEVTIKQPKYIGEFI